MIWICGSQKT